MRFVGGEDYSGYVPETLIESAKESEPQPAQPIQLHLPGFATADRYLLESF